MALWALQSNPGLAVAAAVLILLAAIYFSERAFRYAQRDPLSALLGGAQYLKAIADELGLERSSVQHMVTNLVDSGAVVRTAKGYAAAEPEPDASHARTRTSLPDHSGNSRSDWSDRGHTRAPAREPQLEEVNW